jgi:thioredoxin-like negative regulator of GroEL
VEPEGTKDPYKEPKQPGGKIPGPLQPAAADPVVNHPRQPGSGEQAPPLNPDVTDVSDQTWEKTVEKAQDPVAVMFYSPSCSFCHQMEPYFRAYAKEFRGKVTFVRINILTSQWTAERYAVRSTPTFKFFCSGKPVMEIAGAVYPAILKRTVSEVLVHGKECAKNSTAIDYEITGYG